jgi:acyl carrier protein
LRAHPAVAEAVVAPREDVVGGRRLVAYLVPAEGVPGCDVVAGELQRYLAGRLPAAMIPAAFVTLAALPLTRNGKIDRRALPVPGIERPHLESAYVAPRTPAEQAVSAVWQEVLGQERIGIHDNFFELGGNSLLLVEMERRLREALGREIPVAEMYRNPTIHGLVQALAAPERAAVSEATEATGAMGVLGTRTAGSIVDRKRQFLEDQKQRRAQQRRPVAPSRRNV